MDSRRRVGNLGRRGPAGCGPAALWAALACATAGGCFAPEKPSLTSHSPSAKIPAIKAAGVQKDAKAAPLLVADLDDPDPAVRFAAIEALRSIAGEDKGYKYYDDEEQRKPAVARWKAWLGK